MGPHGKSFVECTVRSIHGNSRQLKTELVNKHRGCLAIKVKKVDLKRNDIHKGWVIIKDKELANNACYEFKAKVHILQHPTTIRTGATFVINSAAVKETARIKLPPDTHLKLGDHEEATFRFMRCPEFMRPGDPIVFREGNTKGTGTVLSVVPLKSDSMGETNIKKSGGGHHKYSRKKVQTKKGVRNMI